MQLTVMNQTLIVLHGRQNCTVTMRFKSRWSKHCWCHLSVTITLCTDVTKAILKKRKKLTVVIWSFTFKGIKQRCAKQAFLRVHEEALSGAPRVPVSCSREDESASGGKRQLVLSPRLVTWQSAHSQPDGRASPAARSNQLRSGGVLPHSHYLSLTVLCCSAHFSSLACWKSQSFTPSCLLHNLFVSFSFSLPTTKKETETAAKKFLHQTS